VVHVGFGLNIPVGYNAEYGRSSGLQISAVTRGGTNRFRGSIYDVERDSDWNANSWTNIQNGNPKNVTNSDCRRRSSVAATFPKRAIRTATCSI
jgi:hypothetical protein